MSFVAAVEDAERAQLIADLKAARAELVKRGRCRGKLYDESTGRVCLLGAVGMAAVEGFEHNYDNASVYDRRPMRAREALEAQLAMLRPERPRVPIFFFNDDHCVTDQDVLDLFDKTLADLGGLA